MLQENRSLERASNETNQEEDKPMFTVSVNIQNPAVQAYGIKRNMMEVITMGSHHHQNIEHAKNILKKLKNEWDGKKFR